MLNLGQCLSNFVQFLSNFVQKKTKVFDGTAPYIINMRKFKNKGLLPAYLRGLATGKYTLQQAAESTGYTPEYLCALKKRYLVEGLLCLEHKSKGKPALNRIPSATRQLIAATYAADFVDVNFSYFQKYLESEKNIKISYPTLRTILAEFGQTSPEAHHKKKKKQVHRPRLRRACEGDLIQIDGTPYAWFYKFGDDKRYCLCGSIDDATGKITGLYLTENECLYGYLEILRQTANNYGIPREIYSDRAAIFCVTPKSKRGHKKLEKWEQLEVLHEERTQWQRILSELNINQILAWSPEAKGRVERMWRTIQGQLPVWLKLRGASNIGQANAILEQYIQEFNKSYAVTPTDDDTFWIDRPSNLEDILQCRIPRTTDKCGGFSFHGYKFAIDTKVKNLCYKKFDLCISERGLYANIDDEYFPIKCIDPYLRSGLGETMPQVLQNIIYRYLFAYAKEISA